MTDRHDFETRLEERLRTRAAIASRPFDAAAIARQVVAVHGRRRRIGRLEWPSARSGFAWLVVGLLLVIALLGAVAVVGALLRERLPSLPSVVSNGWIAYSTSGHGRPPSSTDLTTGSDLYLVRAGAAPRLIAGRAGGTIRNECPAFSPDGRHMAYSVDAGSDRTLVVLGVDDNGAIAETVRFLVPGPGSPVCPRWLSDGTRVAYLDRGTVVVRGLDGSTPAIAAGDPRVEDFGLGRPSRDPVLSPAGDRMVHSGIGCEVVFLAHRRRGADGGRHCRPNSRTLSRLAERPHALASARSAIAPCMTCARISTTAW